MSKLDATISFAVECFVGTLSENGVTKLKDAQIERILKELKDQLEYSFIKEGFD
jgi:hypothetical protein